MKFSIITPCLNQAMFVAESIESVQQQADASVEHVVIDGGSSDETQDILERHADHLLWVAAETRGPADAFNKGLRITSGEWIGWLCADDVYHAGAITKVRQFIAANPTVDVVYGAVQDIDDDGELLDSQNAPSWSLRRFRKDCFIHRPAVFFRRDLLDQCGELDARLSYWYDYDFLLRLANNRVRFAALQEVLASRRLHPDARRRGNICPHRRLAAAEELNDIRARHTGSVSSGLILRYAQSRAESEGCSRELSVDYDRAVIRHASAAQQRWNAGRHQSIAVSWLVCRHVAKEFEVAVKRPRSIARCLPGPLAELVRRHLRHKVFAQSYHKPRPLNLSAAYDKATQLVDPPKISIVTPNLNQGRFIEATIRSILDQRYPLLEYIVQDGGSTDASLDVIRKHESGLARWDSAPDRGQAHAINRGMQYATGEIMAFLNSDDLLLPGSLAYVAAYFQEHPDVDVVYGHRILVDEQGDEISRWILPPHDDRTIPFADYIPQETMFWRRSSWERVGNGLDESFQFALDWDLILRFREAGLRFVRLPRFLGAFRITEDQKTSALIQTVGAREMRKLRKRALGRNPSRREIRRRTSSYLRRHWFYDMFYSLGFVQY